MVAGGVADRSVHLLPFTRMTALGISLIVIGIALVSAGLMLRPAASQTDPAEPHEFRTMIDALDEEDRRSPDEKRD